MAKLARFRANTTAINDGEWIPVNPDDPFEIRTRGFTAPYRDQLNALRREAARKANRTIQPGQVPYTPDALPPSIDDQCQGQALAELAFLDVRGLTNDDGTVTTADQFKEMLRKPAEYGALLVLAIGAASRVHAERQEETKEAGEASGAPSSPS